MKRIVVKVSGMPFDPTYEIDDDLLAISDFVQVPSSDSAFIRRARRESPSYWKAPTPGHASASPGHQRR
jgi:hypothetical protein